MTFLLATTIIQIYNHSMLVPFRPTYLIKNQFTTMTLLDTLILQHTREQLYLLEDNLKSGKIQKISEILKIGTSEFNGLKEKKKEKKRKEQTIMNLSMRKRSIRCHSRASVMRKTLTKRRESLRRGKLCNKFATLWDSSSCMRMKESS